MDRKINNSVLTIVKYLINKPDLNWVKESKNTFYIIINNIRFNVWYLESFKCWYFMAVFVDKTVSEQQYKYSSSVIPEIKTLGENLMDKFKPAVDLDFKLREIVENNLTE